MRVHFVLLAMIAAIHLWPIARPSQELLTDPSQASPYQLHVLANQPDATGAAFDEPFRVALEQASTPLREWLFSTSLAAFAPPRRELRLLLDAWDPQAQGAVPADEWLAFTFQFRKPGGFRVGAADPMSRAELAWTLEAMNGTPVPAEARDVMRPVLGAVGRFLGPGPQGPGRK